jgi:hypothetical protein
MAGAGAVGVPLSIFIRKFLDLTDVILGGEGKVFVGAEVNNALELIILWGDSRWAMDVLSFHSSRWG